MKIIREEKVSDCVNNDKYNSFKDREIYYRLSIKIKDKDTVIILKETFKTGFYDHEHEDDISVEYDSLWSNKSHIEHRVAFLTRNENLLTKELEKRMLIKLQETIKKGIVAITKDKERLENTINEAEDLLKSDLFLTINRKKKLKRIIYK